MQEIEKISPEEKPSEDQASYSEESSTQVYAQILVPLIAYDVYSISDLFSEFYTEYIMHASQESHASNFACISTFICRNVCMRHACILGATCMRHACISRDKNGAAHIRFNSYIF
jgi:hypothetical protein